MNTKIFLVLSTSVFFTFVLCFFILNSSTHLLKVGSKIPSMELEDENGKLRNFSEFSGKKMVIYFYPKDDTPGCTKEACSLRDKYEGFKDKDIVIIGISYDSPKSHKKFKEKYHLPFILLSDSKKKAAKAFGTYSGLLKFIIPKRVTFLVNEKGEITNVIKDVDVTTHADQILDLMK